MFEDEQLDRDLRKAMKLNESDRISVWPSIEREVSPPASIWDYLVPVAAAVFILVVAWSATPRHLLSMPPAELATYEAPKEQQESKITFDGRLIARN